MFSPAVEECPGQFQCGSDECIDTSLTCNGVANCKDESDEYEADCQFGKYDDL